MQQGLHPSPQVQLKPTQAAQDVSEAQTTQRVPASIACARPEVLQDRERKVAVCIAGAAPVDSDRLLSPC